jgi:CubicO group peptidase (beta-lactamase class C family)
MKYLFVIVLSILSYSLKSQSVSPDQKIDSLIRAKQAKYQIPGLSIAVVLHDRIFYNKGFGVKNVNSKCAVDQNTIFHTASLSKLFTAQAVMNLVEKNFFSLDDKLTTLLPEFKMADSRYRDITVRQLLNHTSGMSDIVNYHWSDKQNDPDGLKKYVLSLSSAKLKSVPGKSFSYSSMDYDVLGYLIEQTTHTSFAVFMKQTILQPFGMIYSDFDYFKIDTALRCSPHTKGIFKKIHTRKSYPYNPAHSPSSTLNSSSYELALWMKGLLNTLRTNENHDYLNASTLRSILQPSDNFKFIGLGWFIGERFREKSYYHFGGDRGFRSYLLLLPEHDLGMVLLANCDYEEDFRQEILNGITDILLEKKYKQ